MTCLPQVQEDKLHVWIPKEYPGTITIKEVLIWSILYQEFGAFFSVIYMRHHCNRYLSDSLEIWLHGMRVTT